MAFILVPTIGGLTFMDWTIMGAKLNLQVHLPSISLLHQVLVPKAVKFNERLNPI